MRWSLREIEVFLAVVQEGGFSAAAEHLHMVQPAVSIAVRKLEQKSGVTLLDRSGSRTRLTKEGNVFLGHAKLIRSHFSSLERQLKEMRSLEDGSLRIGAPPLISSFLMPRFIDDFLSAHPGIRIFAEEARSDEIAVRVRDGDLDLGLIAGDSELDKLEISLIENHPIVVCVSTKSKLAKKRTLEWSTIFDNPLVLFPRGYNQRNQVDEVAARLRRIPNVVVEAQSSKLLIGMIRANRGLSVLFSAIAEEFPGVVGIPIVGNPTIPISLCRRAGAPASLASEAICEDIMRFAGARK